MLARRREGRSPSFEVLAAASRNRGIACAELHILDCTLDGMSSSGDKLQAFRGAGSGKASSSRPGEGRASSAGRELGDLASPRTPRSRWSRPLLAPKSEAQVLRFQTRAPGWSTQRSRVSGKEPGIYRVEVESEPYQPPHRTLDDHEGTTQDYGRRRASPSRPDGSRAEAASSSPKLSPPDQPLRQRRRSRAPRGEGHRQDREPGGKQTGSR